MSGIHYTVIVLGSAQDGGVPQLGSGELPVPDRSASSLAVVGSDGTAVLVDASPDLRLQQRRLAADPDYARRSDLQAFDAVLLTHAHMGHYAGLLYFGNEAHSTRQLPCFASPSMLRFLAGNEPWATLFRDGHLQAVTVEPGKVFDIVPGLSAVAHPVPHRPDFSDTLAFELIGPTGRSLLYLPDLDDWSDWPEASGVLSRVDTALVDATFYDDREHPHRDLADIPHPLVTDTIERFAGLASETQIILTHLNWTNRLCDPEAPEHARIRAAGFSVASDGLRLSL